MDNRERLSAIVDRIQDQAGVTQVYGEPVTHDGKTVIPVAKVAYGFGGGYEADGREGVNSTDEQDDGTEGGGIGGGAWATPVGVVELTDEDTRFVSARDRKTRAIVAGVCLVLGYVLGRKSGST